MAMSAFGQQRTSPPGPRAWPPDAPLPAPEYLAGSASGRARQRSLSHVPPNRNSGIAMTLPLRMVQARATAAGEHPCASPMRASVGHGADWRRTAKRRIGHYRHALPLAPGSTSPSILAIPRGYKGFDWSRSDRLSGYGRGLPMSPTLKLETPQARIFPAERRLQTRPQRWRD